MKKILYAAAASLLMLTTACNDDNDFEENTYNLDVSSEAVVLPLQNSAVQPRFLANFQIRVSQNIYEGWAKLHNQSTITVNGENLNFTSPETKTTGNAYSLVVNPLPFDSQDGRKITANAVFTTQYYYYNNSTGEVIKDPKLTAQTGSRMIASFAVGDSYVIKTFQKNTFFAGKTVTTVSATGDNYTNDGILYNVVFDVVNRTATVFMLNAKFNDKAPLISKLRLSNLKLEPTTSGYRVYGENIVPEVAEGNSWVPNDRYKFDSFEVTTATADLTQANIRYSVAGVYKGSCLGSYIYQLQSSQN